MISIIDLCVIASVFHFMIILIYSNTVCNIEHVSKKQICISPGQSRAGYAYIICLEMARGLCRHAA